MPQQEKITKKLDLRNSAVILGHKSQTFVANTTLTNAYADQHIVVSNSTPAMIGIFLPVSNAGNGEVYHLHLANTKPMHIIADTNTLDTVYGLVKSVNFGIAGAMRGSGARIFGDGVNWYLQGYGPISNAVANTYLQA